jgi:hypothetical protein
MEMKAEEDHDAGTDQAAESEDGKDCNVAQVRHAHRGVNFWLGE